MLSNKSLRYYEYHQGGKICTPGSCHVCLPAQRTSLQQPDAQPEIFACPASLLPIDERWYTIYFAHVPLGRFDSWQRRVVPLPQAASFYRAEAGEGEASPSPAPHPLEAAEEKVSGMCPV
jgi:hypothetical protein